MLGPFWCVESNGWLRFDTDNGVAELAVIDNNPILSAEEPILTTPWQNAGDGIFHVFLKDENRHEYYCLKDQILYRLDGENALTGLKAVSKYTNDTWSRENKSRVFDGLIKSTTTPDADFKYPLTPEQQEALKKVKAMFAKEKWCAIQADDNLPIIIAQAMNNGLSEDQNTDLAELLNIFFAANGFSAKHYETHEEYLATLRDLIISQENILHEGLVNLAARTVDPIPSLEVLGDAQAVNQLKKYFFFEILKEMYNYIRKQFGLAEEQLTLEEATPQTAIPVLPPVMVPMEPNGDVDINVPAIEQLNLVAATPHLATPVLPPIIAPVERNEGFAADAAIIEDTEYLPSPILHDHRFIKENFSDYIESIFNKEQCEVLIDQLANTLADILYPNFDYLEDYTSNLRAVIDNVDNEYHQKIIALSFADEFNQNNSEELRQKKYELFIQILIVESCEIMPDEISEITNHSFKDVSAKKKPDPEKYSETDTPPLITSDVDGDENQRQTPVDPIVIIKAALNKARKNYQNWYDGLKPSPRGANGFFSWLRHGSYGQLRATDLNDAVSSCDNTTDAIAKIDEFLTDRQTRYHRHSFASFMLDELKEIKDSPWSSVRFIEDSNKYDSSSLNVPKIQA